MFRIKIYKLCDESGYTYDMKVYLGRDSHSATDDMTATHTIVRHLTGRVEGLGHKLFMDNCVSSPRFLTPYRDKKYFNVGQYGPTEKTCPLTFNQKNETDKGQHKGEDKGKFDRVSLEG